MQRKRGRIRRLPGWFGRRRLARYGALRTVWHPYYGYKGQWTLGRRPTDAYIAAAEYAWQVGAAALLRQLGTVEAHRHDRSWFTNRSKVDYGKVMSAVAKRVDAEQVVVQA